jgi:DNA-binding LacI/PurR family transcriptional regulator
MVQTMPTLIDRHLKIPKYLQLAEHLREQIDGGVLQPDDQLPSFTEMKARFDAAQRTIEKAHALLENDGLIRREPGRGIFVNHPMQRKVTGNVGFLAPYNMRPEENVAYWGSVLAGMRSAARDRGYHLLLIDNGSDFERWDKIDGAVLCDTHDPRDPQPGMPQPPHGFLGVAILNRVNGFACVTTDDFEGAYQLTRHLIELGHRRIAYLATVNAGLSLLNKRKEGYLKALSEAGIEPDPCWMRELRRQRQWDGLPDWYPMSGETSMRCWLEEDWDELGCTALVSQNDGAAQGAIKAFRAAGREVPRDVSVVGFDGLPARSGEPQLTTIQIPLFDVGERAMQSLIHFLQNPSKKPRDVCLPVNLIKGQTTADAPVAARQ